MNVHVTIVKAKSWNLWCFCTDLPLSFRDCPFIYWYFVHRKELSSWGICCIFFYHFLPSTFASVAQHKLSASQESKGCLLHVKMNINFRNGESSQFWGWRVHRLLWALSAGNLWTTSHPEQTGQDDDSTWLLCIWCVSIPWPTCDNNFSDLSLPRTLIALFCASEPWDGFYKYLHIPCRKVTAHPFGSAVMCLEMFLSTTSPSAYLPWFKSLN